MTLAEFAAIMRKRWFYVAVSFLMFCGVATAVSKATTPSYQAHASTYFQLPFGQSATDLFQGSNYTQQQLGSYARLAREPIVLDRVIDRLGLDMTAKELGHSITAVASADSVIIEITASSRFPERAAQVANTVSEELQTVVQDLSPELANGDPSVEAVTIAEATPPKFPSSPNTKRNVFGAGLIGIFLGLLVALARDKLDTRLRTSEDLPDGISVLTSIEYDKSLRHGKPAVDVNTSTSGSRQVAVREESYRKLRTNLRFLDVDNPVKVIVMTSSVAGEGKTSTSINLARVFAQDGQRVLLIDADMRRPKIAEYLAIEGAVGLADVLAGTVPLKLAVQRWLSDSSHILPSGSIPPNPSELLGSRAMVELVEHVREIYDHVIIDLPPLLPVTDASVASVIADGVVLVVRHGKTNQKQFRQSMDALNAVEARLLGVAFNLTPPPKPWQKRSSYYYYYQTTSETKPPSKLGGQRSHKKASSVEEDSLTRVGDDRV